MAIEIHKDITILLENELLFNQDDLKFATNTLRKYSYKEQGMTTYLLNNLEHLARVIFHNMLGPAFVKKSNWTVLEDIATKNLLERNKCLPKFFRRSADLVIPRIVSDKLLRCTNVTRAPEEMETGKDSFEDCYSRRLEYYYSPEAHTDLQALGQKTLRDRGRLPLFDALRTEGLRSSQKNLLFMYKAIEHADQDGLDALYSYLEEINSPEFCGLQ